MPHRQRSHKPIRVAERGVYEHPFVGPEGELYMFAVDRFGRRIMEATVFPWISDPGVVTAFLRAVLDQQDPTHIRLVP